MYENFEEINKKVLSLVELKFLPVIKNSIKAQKQFTEKCRPELNKLLKVINSIQTISRWEVIEQAIKINEKIKLLISLHFEKENKTSLRESFPDFFYSLDQLVSQTPENITNIQDENKFKPSASDNFLIRLRKQFKKFFLIISNLSITFFNFWRRLFNKHLIKKNQWKRIIRLKRLRQFVFTYTLFTKLLIIQKTYYQKRSITAKGLWKIYESIDNKLNSYLSLNEQLQENEIEPINITPDLDDLQSTLTAFEESLPSEVSSIVELVLSDYKDKYDKAGTIEFPKRHLKVGTLKGKNKQLNQFFLTLQAGWENNFIALGDDWQMNNEVYLIRYILAAQFEKRKIQFHNSIKGNLFPSSEKMISFINELKELLNSSARKPELLAGFKDIKKRISAGLTNKIIPEFTSTLLEQNLSRIVAELDNGLQEQITNIKPQRVLVKSDEYDDEIKNSEINVFSPKEILEYSAAPKYFSHTADLKKIINNQVQQIQIDLSEIDHILEFTIDSAINKFEMDNDSDKSKLIAIEGIHRTIKKIAEIEQKLNELLDLFDSELDLAIKEFNYELRNLTQTEKLFDIRLNLAKAKALQRSKLYRKQILEKVKNFLPRIFKFIRKSIVDIKTRYQKVRKVFGLAPGETVIASEVSDYLAETQSAIFRLPFVYQRLFEIKPLDDERFFFGREAELAELQKALTNWEKEKFAPTIIVGEKGSGATSLINNFLTTHRNDYKIIRCSVNHSITETDDFLKLLSDVLGIQKLNSVNDVISHLNSLQAKQIIVIENLQRLFLRKVEGFKVLKMFFEIISRTSKNIFWLSTCTIYGWTYLDKTIHAPDYFAYIIHLKKLNEEQITNLVSKRHRVSGYNIDFEADETTLNSRAFKKMPESDKQPYLKTKYFAELNKFAQSNTSLAFIFWLRSTKEIYNDLIKIGPPPELAYSFLENLSNDKIFTLAALLIHDGLNIEDHSKIFSCSMSKSRLLFLLMYDDGIIVEQNDLFLINPLLYRQIVGMLKSKNIIH